MAQFARRIRDSGLAPTTATRLAAALAGESGAENFKNKIYAAAKYGFLLLPPFGTPGAGLVTPLPLLDALDDPAREAVTRAQAYLNVPLHRAFFERYRDQVLPPDEVVQRELVEGLGVSAGQEKNVRRVVLKAATQAGLLGLDRRLVLPSGLTLAPDGTIV